MAPPKRTLWPRYRAFLREQSIEWPNWFYTAPLILWVLIISLGSVAPPDYLPQFTVRNADKFEHTLSYALLGLLFLRAWTRQEPTGWRAVLAVWTLSFLWGAYLEVMQGLTPLRTMDVRDALANGVGVALGEILWLAIRACERRWGTAASEADPPPGVDPS
jgi:VanZ family protein